MKDVCFAYLIVLLVSAIPAAAQATPAGQKPELHFAEPVAYDSGGEAPESVAVADLRGDGKIDLVVAHKWQDNSAAGTVSVILGNGDGTFQPALTYATGAYYGSAVAVGDLTGNGILDLVVANGSQTQQCACVGAVSVLLGNGDGTFQPAVIYSVGAYEADSVTLGDLRGNGILDVVATDGGQGGDSEVAVLLGNGDGTFQSAINYDSGGFAAESVAIADLTGNGIPDLVVTNACENEGCQGDGTAGVLLGNGDGTFQPVALYDSGGNRSNSVAVGDLRGNGVLDLVVASEERNNVVGALLGNGDGTFQPPVTYVLDGRLGAEVAIGDLNGDGIPDLAVTNACHKVRGVTCIGDAPVNVLLGNGDGTFQPPIEYSSGGFAAGAIAIADLNGDGRPDLAITICQDIYCDIGLVSVLLNESSYKEKTALTASPSPAQVNQPVSFTATITPAPPNGEVVTFYNGKTSLGTGTTKNGVASLTTSFAAAKTYTIKANYPGDAFRKKSSGTVKLLVSQ